MRLLGYPSEPHRFRFGQGTAGGNKSLVPVVVEKYDVEGLLGQVVHINLVGLDPIAAQKKLIAGLQPGRSKPLAPPPFPGASTSPATQAKKDPAPPTVQWFPLNAPLSVVWRSDLSGIRREGGST